MWGIRSLRCFFLAQNPYPIRNQNGKSHGYPFSDRNGAKTLPDRAAHTYPGGVLPDKGLMGTCSQPGYVFRDFCFKQGIEFIIFCLNQAIDFINFCLKQDIYSWTINSLHDSVDQAVNSSVMSMD